MNKRLIKIKHRIWRLLILIFNPRLLVLITVAFFLADYILFKLLGDNFGEKSVLFLTIYTTVEIYITIGVTGLLVSWVKKKKVYKPIILLLILTLIAIWISYKVGDLNSRLGNFTAFIVIVLFLSSMFLIVNKIAKTFKFNDLKLSFKQTFNKRNVIIIILIFALSAWLLPSFAYNELEFQFRKEYIAANYTFEQVDKIISYRRSEKDPLSHQKEMIQAAQDIEKGVDLIIVRLEKARDINNEQDFVPLLPSKYNNYHKQKKEAIDKYLSYIKNFKIKKQNDHMLSDTTARFFRSGDIIRNAGKENDFWIEVEKLPEEATAISTQAQRLYIGDFITRDLLEYFSKRSDVAMFIYNQSQKVKATGSWNSFDAEGLTALLSSSETEVDVNKLFEESNKISSSIQRKLDKDYKEAYSLIEKTSGYYDENALAFDKLSVFISKFNNNFPRNHAPNANNLFLPPNIDPDLVSMLVSPILQ